LIERLDAAASGEQQKPLRRATAAVTKATRTQSRDLPKNVADWSASDVQNWLRKNDLAAAVSKYDVTQAHSLLLSFNLYRKSPKCPVIYHS